jgi:hypothetical protein
VAPRTRPEPQHDGLGDLKVTLSVEDGFHLEAVKGVAIGCLGGGYWPQQPGERQ